MTDEGWLRCRRCERKFSSKNEIIEVWDRPRDHSVVEFRNIFIIVLVRRVKEKLKFKFFKQMLCNLYKGDNKRAHILVLNRVNVFFSSFVARIKRCRGQSICRDFLTYHQIHHSQLSFVRRQLSYASPFSIWVPTQFFLTQADCFLVSYCFFKLVYVLVVDVYIISLPQCRRLTAVETWIVFRRTGAAISYQLWIRRRTTSMLPLGRH